MSAVLASGLSNAGLSFLISVGFAWLFAVHRRTYLLHWSTGWLLAAAGVGLGAVELHFGPSRLTAIGLPLVTLGALQLLRGAYAVVERSVPRVWFVAAAVALAVSLFAAAAGLPLEAAAALPGVCSLLCMGGVGAVLLRQRPRRRGAWVAGFAYIAMAVNSSTFPIAVANPWFLPWGFVIATLLAASAAGGLLILHYDQALRRIEHGQTRYRRLFDNALTGVFQANADGTLLEANAALTKMLGYGSTDALRPGDRLVDRLVDPGVWPRLTDGDGPRRIAGQEIAWRRIDGREIVCVVDARCTVDSTGVSRVEGMLQDVTESQALRRQLSDARRLEAVGSLAGGIAHDFNNLLTIIITQTELLTLDVDDPAAVTESAEAIGGAADQARRLTRQLLAFGRGTVLAPAEIDLTQVVDDLVTVFERVIPANISLSVTRPDSARVVVDRGSVEQLASNLLTNACAAMPDGGRLALSLTVTDPPPAGVLPGPWVYVELAVSDDGEGIDDETRSRMFEPFFTTRKMGRGTGLGLARFTAS